jgi:hypothetical protein
VFQSVFQLVFQSKFFVFMGVFQCSSIFARARIKVKCMHHTNTVTDIHTSNFYRKFGRASASTGTLEHALINRFESADSGVPVSSNGNSGTGTPEHRTDVALFVSTSLQSWVTDQPHVFACDVQIGDTAYRRLDPEYYAWLRSRMSLAKLAAQAGRLSPEAFDELREKFNAVHGWAMAHFGEDALREAVRNLDARGYAPPVAESDKPVRPARVAEYIASDAVAMVDAIRDRAFSLGWTERSLYGTGGPAHTPFGKACDLASLLKTTDRIGEVTRQSIEIILPNGVRQRFYNPDVEQPWIRRA